MDNKKNMNCHGVPLHPATETRQQRKTLYPRFAPVANFIFFLGSTPDDTAPCTHDDRVQGRVHGNTRDEKAHSVEYGRISAFIKAARGSEYGGELRTA